MSATKQIGGTLGIAETSILGSSIAWSISRSDGAPTVLTSIASFDPDAIDRGYVIRSSGDNPRYWTSFAPGRVELAAGAGDFGLAKCIRAAERHLSSNKVSSPQR
jgi:hypothetical protein